MAHGEDVWFAEPCEEIALTSDRYDFTISLLHLEAAIWSSRFEDAADEDDAYDRMVKHATRRG